MFQYHREAVRATGVAGQEAGRSGQAQAGHGQGGVETGEMAAVAPIFGSGRDAGNVKHFSSFALFFA